MMVLRVVAGYTKFVDCNPLTALIRFVLYLLYNLFLHCCEAFGKILTNTSHPAVHVWCQSFLLSNNIVCPSMQELGSVHCYNIRHRVDAEGFIKITGSQVCAVEVIISRYCSKMVTLLI